MIVCWMLTDRDGRNDGNRLGYLEHPDVFGWIDPPLFEALGRLVTESRRSVADVQAASLLPGAVFVDSTLVDSEPDRSAYFEAVWRALRSRDLVFFDPDNGMAVKSVPKGRRGSSKYLYWDELGRAVQNGRSVCVYQHFPRVPREQFVLQSLARIADVAPRHCLFALHTANVAYLIAVAREDADRLLAAAELIATRFAGRLRMLRPEALDRVPKASTSGQRLADLR